MIGANANECVRSGEPRPQLLDVPLRDLSQRDPQCIRRDGEAPECIAKLERHRVAVERTTLKEVLSNVCQHLACLLGQSSRGVEEPLVVGERTIDRAPRLRLIPGQRRHVLSRARHAYVTRGSAFA